MHVFLLRPGFHFPDRYPLRKRMNLPEPDSHILIEIVSTKMPFGRYQGTLIAHLPVSYLEWFERQGFPEGKIGILLSTMYEIRTNGLEFLLHRVEKWHAPRSAMGDEPGSAT